MKKLIALILVIGLFGCGTIPVKDSPPPDLARMAEQGSVSKARVFTSIAGPGVSGSIKNIATANISDNDPAWVIESDDVLSFYRFEKSSTTANDSPYYLRPDDYSSAGVWYLISSIKVRPTATPSITGRDSDQANDPTWSITGNSDGTDGDMDLKVQEGDSLVAYINLDGQDETIKINRVLANVPQSKTYADNEDDDETIGTDLTSSVILVTGDDDTDNDSIDLQDGDVNGQMITFIAVAGVDADDTFTVDAETDSTCTGCPNSGILVIDTVGDSISLVWSGTAWFFISSHEQ